MAQYAKGVALQIDSLRIAAFDVAKQALKNVPGEAPSPQAVKDGLWMSRGSRTTGSCPRSRM